MSRYTVHGRRFEGSLEAPTRNETESDSSDVYDAALRAAQSMSRRGFSVWMYEDQQHGLSSDRVFSPASVPGGGRWRVVAQWHPFGIRIL